MKTSNVTNCSELGDFALGNEGKSCKNGVNDSVSDQLVSLVRDSKDQLDVLVHQDTASYSYRVEQVPHGGRGRPKFVVSREQLQYLLERGFSVPDVAQLLGLSLWTTERRLQEFGISSGQFFTTIDNETLDHTVETILRSFPSYGYRRMTGSLLSRGIKVRQVRIRESMRRVNPEGILLRALTINTIARRKYRVYAPLALWHVDGNHKLIRVTGLSGRCKGRRQDDPTEERDIIAPRKLHHRAAAS
ncbi:uncharacterized protein [Montipora foliosa]|uniref:uncharacterized protein n=1 Tax=Montipora foliosa TaxID=591990 RepID=UPI0035F1B3D3